MRLFLFALLLSAITSTAQEDFNLELIANVPITETGNDIWGYVSPDGTEYAIMGSVNATYIFSLADPASPRQVARIEGTNSTWRDMKTWQEYLYVVSDAGADGLLIVDMREIENDSVVHKFWQPVLSVLNDTIQLERCHNIYIDENGYAYMAGCNVMSDRNDRGAVILDLNPDPWNPVYVGAETRQYAHDLYVRDNLMYASEIYIGEIAIYDVTDKANPVFINSAPTSFNFTHNAWTSDDGDYVFTTDERGNAFVDAFDISDLNDIKLVDRYRPLETENLGVIPHNTHYHDGFLVTSWYTDGVVILDASRPDNLIKVGAYDTYDGPHGGFSGCWGAYPFLPSGLILASDRQTGLYVLEPKYGRAAYLEGTITNADDGMAINDAAIEIISTELNTARTDATGRYKTGLSEEGMYTVRVTHPDFRPLEATVDLQSGEVTILDAALEPYNEVLVDIDMIDIFTLEGVPHAKLKIFNESKEFYFEADSTGRVQVSLFDEPYFVIAGAWGYLHEGAISFDPTAAQELIIELQPGYQDDFVFDLGWTVSGDAETGHWERGIPIGTADPDVPGGFANVNMDDPSDLGVRCYMTGNGGGSAGDDDVDNGVTTLSSPLIFSNAEDPVVSYNIWFTNSGGQGPADDTLYVKIANNETEIIVDVYAMTTGGWTGEHIVSLAGLPLDLTAGFHIIFETSDMAGSGHIVEAGVDAFFMSETPLAAENGTGFNKFELFPNPFTDRIDLVFDGPARRLVRIFDMTGRETYNGILTGDRETIDMSLPPGMYILNIEGPGNQHFSRLILRQ